jgi:hypothetical protein
VIVNKIGKNNINNYSTMRWFVMFLIQTEYVRLLNGRPIYEQNYRENYCKSRIVSYFGYAFSEVVVRENMFFLNR